MSWISGILLLFLLAIVCVTIARLVVGLITICFEGLGYVLRLGSGAPRPGQKCDPPVLGSACPHDKCGCVNPISARFCRRCGRTMPSPLS